MNTGNLIECICAIERDARPCTQEMKVDGLFLSGHIHEL